MAKGRRTSIPLAIHVMKRHGVGRRTRQYNPRDQIARHAITYDEQVAALTIFEEWLASENATPISHPSTGDIPDRDSQTRFVSLSDKGISFVLNVVNVKGNIAPDWRRNGCRSSYHPSTQPQAISARQRFIKSKGKIYAKEGAQENTRGL